MTSAKCRISDTFVVPKQNQANRSTHSANPKKNKKLAWRPKSRWEEGEFTIHWKTQGILAVGSESTVFYKSPWRSHGDSSNTMDSDPTARIHCVFQWILNSPSSHLDFGLQGNFLFFLRICWTCGAIRLVLLGNDKCLRDSALRGGQFCHFPDFVAPLSWNGRSSKCRLHLNVFRSVLRVRWWEY